MPINITESLVRRLIASQFPQWKDLPVVQVLPGGWDNRTFRLGDALLARLPSEQAYELQVAKEHRWLNYLRPHLTCLIPQPVAQGVPGEGYPFNWSVYQWEEGSTLVQAKHVDGMKLADDLVGFLRSLWSCDTPDAPPPGPHNFERGGDLRQYDDEVSDAIAHKIADTKQRDYLQRFWNKALSSHYVLPLVWIHGDMLPGNILIKDARLHAVIDFGLTGIGDPAVDLSLAWVFFHGEIREYFINALPEVDSATWNRARGWALWKAIIALYDKRVSDDIRMRAQSVINNMCVEGVI